MANHPSAEKRYRQNLKRRERNRQAKGAVRTVVKRVVELAESGKDEAAAEQLREATKLLDKAAIHGVLHKNNARRKISRLQKKVNSAA